MDRKYSEVSDIDKNIFLLIARGAKLWSVEDNLRFSAPAGVLSSSDTQWLLEHKAQVIASLAARKED